MYKSRVKTKLQNSINASKIDYNIESNELCKKIMTQLSNTGVRDTNIYHIESLYRDNVNDKYELSKLQQNPKIKNK
jgi:hypothetical protein